MKQYFYCHNPKIRL